jgi:two-component system, chemotaxis family, CheB/CheR fusion protein
VSESDPDFEALLVYLKETRGFDFTGYKRSSLMRRMSRRMSQANIDSYAGYLEHLEVHPDEFATLFNTILINVTGFFRDAEAWDHLRREVLPQLTGGAGPIRVWSAGCASGQEAYTIAILLAEELGLDDFRQRVKIYATDVDENALTYARQATYSEQEMADVPPEYVERYFEVGGGRYTVCKDLRRAVIFGRNDLMQDAPISRLGLLVCRNTLMYFNAEAQARILARFHYALSPQGVVFLGKAEMLLSHGDLFAPVDLKRRMFRKVASHVPATGHLPVEPHAAGNGSDPGGLDRIRSEAFLTNPVAQVVVNNDGFVALVNRQAEILFGVSARDVGRPFRDLDLSYRPTELRGYIEQAQLERRPQRITDVEYRRSGEAIHLELRINPLVNTESQLLGVMLVFFDVSAARRLQDELEAANRELETAYEELQSTNEELETTNEELQSTVEELETTNEELQSTNEELETTNEELQSANDEMQAVNDELRHRTAELDRLQIFLEAVFASLQAAVVVLDRDLRVQAWNRRCDDLWGLRAEEAVGQHFLNLDIGLPTDELRPMIRQVFTVADQIHEIRLTAVNRRGRHIQLRVIGSPLRGRDEDVVTGAIMIMEPDEARG